MCKKQFFIFLFFTIYDRWDADEVGVQLSDMKAHLLSTHQTVRAKLTNEHVTVLITSNRDGEQAPLYLLFPGEYVAEAPKEILKRTDTLDDKQMILEQIGSSG